MKQRSFITNRHSGMTLIEIVISLVVLSIILVVAGQFVLSSATMFNIGKSNITTLNKLRFANERLSKEIRHVDFTGSQYDITTKAASRFVFTKTDGTAVDFNLNGTDLEMTYSTLSVTPTPILLDNVTSLDFNYYQYDGTTANAAADVKEVEFEIMVTESGISYSTKTRILLKDA